jgi:hypothetical protein
MKKILMAFLLLAGCVFAADIPDGYELQVDTRSPDGRYALLYPDGSSEKDPPNLLVQLNPYKVLAEIRPGVPKGATLEVFTTWSGSSTVAIHQFRKWGLVGLWVYELEGDKVKRVHPVLDEVRKVFKKDFQERVRKKYPKEPETIIFVSGEGDENPVPEFEFKGRKLVLNFFADNKPNLASGVHWNATFKGEWNLDLGKLENAKLIPGEVEIRGD